MSQSGDDNKISIIEYRDTCQKEFNDDLKKIDMEVQAMHIYMKDAHQLSENKHLLYKKRQACVRRKFEIADKIVFISRNMKTLRKTKINNYKFGNVKNDTGSVIKPANDFERKLYLESDLASFEEAKQILDNHIGFIEDTIKTLSDMIFGIPYVIQLEDFKKMLK